MNSTPAGGGSSGAGGGSSGAGGREGGAGGREGGAGGREGGACGREGGAGGREGGAGGGGARSAFRGPGPSVVALGGGHGLATTLSAVRRYAAEVTAIVSVADDGGSSGRLREVWAGPAPGDVRHCLLSLAGSAHDAPPMAGVWAAALDYRFRDGELAGHSLGNLVLLALTETTGDFVAATAEVGRLLGVGATVLPATAVAVGLRAEMGGREISGQTRIAHTPEPVSRVWLEPPAPPAPPAALEAIASADQVVIGPGSLFTSVLAVCVVPGVAQALAGREGGRVYVCNLRPQETETLGFDADSHLAALAAHGVVVDTVLCDPATTVGAPSAKGLSALAGPPALVEASLAKPNGHSHDPVRLAGVLKELAQG